MHKLSQSVIRDLADHFMMLTTDESRQMIVDSLGSVIYNHVEFVRHLSKFGHPNDYMAYLDMITYLED